MKRLIALAALLAITSLTNASDMDSDGVPVVNIHGKIELSKDEKAIESSKKWGGVLPRTRVIDVDGRWIPLAEFLYTYCQGKSQNKTCSRGVAIKRIDSISGPKEVLPKGL